MVNRINNSIINPFQYFVKAKLVLVFFVAMYFNVYAQKTPTFTQYAVEVEKKTTKNINFNSHPEATIYQTNLKNALAHSAVNFGGKYILTTWGCGSGCLQGAIIDVHSGNVFFPQELQGVDEGGILTSNQDMLEYKKESKLLIIRGYVGNGFESETQSNLGIYYYEWNGKSFKLLKFIKK